MHAEEKPERNSDLKAWLDTRFRGPLMSYFTRRIGDRAEAEDLTQEVFVRIIASATFEEIERADAFIFKVASNLLRDRNRKILRQKSHHSLPMDEAVIDEIAEQFVEERGPERVLLGRERLSDVLGALGELGERTRNIFILFRLEGMKQKDIAALYGISASTVEKHVMKAVMHLSLRFGDE